MAQLLNKKLVMCILFALPVLSGLAQDNDASSVKPDYKDYKDPAQFYKFHKRSKIVSAWQINELKNGALVVRLRTNKKLIDALRAEGKEEMASEKEAEQFIINKNTVIAYVRNFSFCKLYFTYSNNSDTLLKGARTGIFLDTNLVVDPTIKMTENFYLLAERDYAFNSSIGFVREDSAGLVKETGNPVREMGVVIKNKYGHQLKGPFPYYVKDKTFANYTVPYYIVPTLINGKPAYDWVPADGAGAKESLAAKYPNAARPIRVEVKKQYSYRAIAIVIDLLNENLSNYYQSSPKPEADKMSPFIKPYLY
jgi:hypothetical protein